MSYPFLHDMNIILLFGNRLKKRKYVLILPTKIFRQKEAEQTTFSVIPDQLKFNSDKQNFDRGNCQYILIIIILTS